MKHVVGSWYAWFFRDAAMAAAFATASEALGLEVDRNGPAREVLVRVESPLALDVAIMAEQSARVPL